MSILYFLIPLALALAGVAVWGFLWAVRSGQYDDVETPAIRMLLDDDSHGNVDAGQRKQVDDATLQS